MEAWGILTKVHIYNGLDAFQKPLPIERARGWQACTRSLAPSLSAGKERAEESPDKKKRLAFLPPPPSLLQKEDGAEPFCINEAQMLSSLTQASDNEAS